MSKFNQNHTIGAQTLTSGSLVQEYHFFIDAHACLSVLERQGQTWGALVRYCEALEQTPQLMEALTVLHACSQIDFERALFCSWSSLLLSRSLSLSAESQGDLYYAGLFQDIGKYAPESNVQNLMADLKGRQSSDNVHDACWDSHPLVSSAYVEQYFSDRSYVRELVLHHHARADGSGYPKFAGESQLALEHQVLIIANEISDQVDKLGGHNQLFSCLPSLQLGRLLYFRRAYDAWCEVLSAAQAEMHETHGSVTNIEQEALDRALSLPAIAPLKKCQQVLLRVSSELLPYDYDHLVKGLRASIARLVLLSSETGITDETVFSESADISSQEVHELKSFLSAIAETLERILQALQYVLGAHEFKLDPHLLNDAQGIVSQCIRVYGEGPPSVFR